jgi:predicted DCC family thiol-disulfide oxidoreductase YuxK
MTKLTTFYDGGCPLCSKEIDHYRRLDRERRVRWVDITDAGDELSAAGLDVETAMRRLHVREADGRMLSGAPAFVAIWRRLPRYRWLARAVEGARLTRPLNRVYARFADWRFERRCRDGVCATRPCGRASGTG